MALTILVLLLSYLLWLSYRDQVRAAEVSTRNLASIFETRLDVTLHRIDADLKVFCNEIPSAALSQKTVPFYEREINTALDRRLLSEAEMAGYRVYDMHGDLLYTSDKAHTVRANVADREYFQTLRDDPTTGLVFSDVVTGKTTGRQVLVVSRALRDAQGRFLGVVHGILELDYYRRQFGLLDLGEHGYVSLRRSDNHELIVRVPSLADGTRSDLADDHPFVSSMRKGVRSINASYEDIGDHEPRILGAQVMQEYPFYFTVAYGRGDVLAGWKVQLGVVAVMLSLLLTLTGILIRRLGRMRVREAGILDHLARSEMQFNELAQLVPVGIAHFDKNGRYTFVNSRYRLLTGRSSEDSLGKDWTEFVHVDDRARLREAWSIKRGVKQTPDCEYRIVRPDGHVTHVIGEFRPEFDNDGEVQGFIVAQTDVTQLKMTEAELLVAKQQAENANMAKTRFLAAASHDLRQPIQAINLFRDALGRTDLTEEQRSISNFLSKSVRLLGELLYSLLDISKLDAGQIVPQIETILLEELFMVIDAEFSPIAQQRGLRFKLFYPVKEIRLRTDPRLLLTVLRNLIDNAMKYTETGGILVSARRRAKGLVIQVWDTGIGIDRRFGDQIFDECFQIGNPVRDRSKGIGIGLSIARRTVRLLNGELSYRSRLGSGSVFEIDLSASDAVLSEGADRFSPVVSMIPESTEESAASGMVGWRVMVIEDDPVVAKSVEICLQTLGINVVVLANAEQALMTDGIFDADFYISDFNLPGMNGVQLLDAIRLGAGRPIEAVLVTGETSTERIESMSSSAWTILFKPVGLAKLLAVMNEACLRRATAARSGMTNAIGSIADD